MKYTFSIRHYQPEIEFLKHKGQSRLCSQSSACFVVDMTDHGSVRAFYAPENFFADKHAGKLEMTGDEQKAFLQSLEVGTRFYFCHRGKPFLVFTDWLQDTGLLLIISPDADALATKNALLHFPSSGFSVGQTTLTQAIDLVEWKAAFDLLSEVFSLIDFVVEESTFKSAYQVLAGIAALLGCLPNDDHVLTSTFSNWEIS